MKLIISTLFALNVYALFHTPEDVEKLTPRMKAKYN